MRAFILSLLLSIFIVFSASVFSADARKDVKSEVTGAYVKYIEAAKTGDIEKVLPLFSASAREFYRSITKTPEGKAFLAGVLKDTIPVSYEIKKIKEGKDGKSAEMTAEVRIAEISRPGLKAPAGHFETNYSFVSEEGAWRLDSVIDTFDLGNMLHPEDYSYNPADMDEDVTGVVGGPIVKLVYEKDHTLVVVRVIGAENAVFLPSKEELIKYGADLSIFEPGNITEFEGHPHKTDKQKFFATGANNIQPVGAE